MTATSKQLNDLIWCLESPSLLTDTFQDFSIIDHLDASLILDDHPLDSLEHDLREQLSQSKSHFLGVYFEQLWKFYLTHHPSYKLVASNFQVHEKSKTIGEFDFIVYDEIYQQYVHQELAIKFYLGHPSGSKPLWIGPQTVDRLDKKMDHLITHQLKLSELPAAQHALKELGIKHLTHQLLMKGYLFQPAHLPKLPLPEYVNSNCLQGSWLPVSEFKKRLESDKYKSNYWRPLSKVEWLVPFCSHVDQSQREDHAILDDPFASDIDFSRPVLFSRLSQEAHLYIEEEKLFIVSDDWPHLTKTSPAL